MKPVSESSGALGTVQSDTRLWATARVCPTFPVHSCSVTMTEINASWLWLVLFYQSTTFITRSICMTGYVLLTLDTDRHGCRYIMPWTVLNFFKKIISFPFGLKSKSLQMQTIRSCKMGCRHNNFLLSKINRVETWCNVHRIPKGTCYQEPANQDSPASARTTGL